MPVLSARQVTLRLPDSLYSQVKRMARQRRVSVNRLMQERLESLAAESLALEMGAAYAALGKRQRELPTRAMMGVQREALPSEASVLSNA